MISDRVWSYIFGNLTTTSGADFVTRARLFAISIDGLITQSGHPDGCKY